MSRCKSCDAEILWAITPNNKRIPVDPQPSPGGNLRLTEGRPLLATIIGPTIDLLDPTDDGTRYMPHHATCPDGKEWKKKP